MSIERSGVYWPAGENWASNRREVIVKLSPIVDGLCSCRCLFRLDAALAAEADRGTPDHESKGWPCGNCHHDPDIHSPVNRELCAVPGCDCPGLLTSAEADRGTGNALQRLAEQARTAATYDEWHALGRAVIALAEATK